MIHVVASTPAPPLPPIPPSSPSLWAELPSLPGSLEAWSQQDRQQQQQQQQQIGDRKRLHEQQKQEATLALEHLFDDDDFSTRSPPLPNDNQDPNSASPSERPKEATTEASIATRDPFELFDVGSPWTQVNPSTQCQRRIWLGRYTPLQVDASAVQPGCSSATRPKKLNKAVDGADVSRKRRAVQRNDAMDGRRMGRGLAIDIMDDTADPKDHQAGPSVPRSRPGRRDQDALRQTSDPPSPPVNPCHGKQPAIRSPPADAQTPRPRPKARPSKPQASDDLCEQSPPQTALGEVDHDFPNSTQFFTRTMTRPLSPTDESRIPEQRTAAQLRETDSVVSSLEAAKPNEDSARALSVRTVSFGQLSKDDEDALESFVEDMDSEDEDASGGTSQVVRLTNGTSVGEVPTKDLLSQQETQLSSATVLHETEDSLSHVLSPWHEEDEDDPSAPSGLAPLLPELDEEKRRGYFAQFDSILDGTASTSALLARGGGGDRERSLILGLKDSDSPSSAVNRARSVVHEPAMHWPTTPSRRQPDTSSVNAPGTATIGAAGRFGHWDKGLLVERANSDSRLLPTRFEGFSRPIVSCSQLEDLDSPSLHRRGTGGVDAGSRASIGRSSTSHEDESTTIPPAAGVGGASTATATAATLSIVVTPSNPLPARSRNPVGMGLVRKTWNSTWRSDGSRMVRGRVVPRTAAPSPSSHSLRRA